MPLLPIFRWVCNKSNKLDEKVINYSPGCSHLDICNSFLTPDSVIINNECFHSFQPLCFNTLVKFKDLFLITVSQAIIFTLHRLLSTFFPSLYSKLSIYFLRSFYFPCLSHYPSVKQIFSYKINKIKSPSNSTG